MSISDNYVPIRQLGNGATTQFSGTWAMLAAAYAAVFLEDVTTGVQTAQTLGVDYTLVFDSSGFTVTFIVAPPSTKYAVVGRSVSNDQTDPYRTSKGFQGEVIEASFDKLTAITQDLSETITRSLKFPLGSSAVGAMSTPVDDTVLAWSGTGGTLKNGPTTASLTAGATNAAASATAAAASASASATSATASGVSAASAAASAITAQAAAAGMQYRAVRVGSVANVSISSAPSTVDGITLTVNDRVVLKDQSTASQNGIYQFNGAGSAMTRTSDFNSWTQVPGTVVIVEEGAVNADRALLCTSDAGGTIGATAITFVDWSAVIFNNTITNAKLAQMATLTIKSNITGGTANAADSTLSAIIDACIGNTRGNVLYRGASGWAALGVGTAGQILQTGGAGADPSWANAPTNLMTPLAVGSIIFAQYSGALPLAAGTTVAAGTLTAVTLALVGASTGVQASGDSLAGTWKALVSYLTNNSYVGLWQRVS